MMFGSIVVSGIGMIADCGFSQRNTTIAALSLSIGIGFTQIPEIYQQLPALFRDIFSSNPVANVFVIAIVMSLILPKERAEKQKEN